VKRRCCAASVIASSESCIRTWQVRTMQRQRLLREAQLVQLQLLQLLPEARVHSTLPIGAQAQISKPLWQAWCAQDTYEASDTSRCCEPEVSQTAVKAHLLPLRLKVLKALDDAAHSKFVLVAPRDTSASAVICDTRGRGCRPVNAYALMLVLPALCAVNCLVSGVVNQDLLRVSVL
jgi:hypothetical protein